MQKIIESDGDWWGLCFECSIEINEKDGYWYRWEDGRAFCEDCKDDIEEEKDDKKSID